MADAQQTLFWRYLHPELYSTPTAGARPPALAFGDFFTAAREGRGVLRPMPTGQRYWPLEVNMQIANFFAGEFERRRHGDVARQAASGERRAARPASTAGTAAAYGGEGGQHSTTRHIKTVLPRRLSEQLFSHPPNIEYVLPNPIINRRGTWQRTSRALDVRAGGGRLRHVGGRRLGERGKAGLGGVGRRLGICPPVKVRSRSNRTLFKYRKNKAR